MSRNPFLPHFADLPAELPIFPLPGAVVMPGVQLPLNIFEPRYLNMVADALGGPAPDRHGPAHQRDASDEVPEIHRIGCAGRITSYSETTDGRIVLVLTGVCRFQVAEEWRARHGYRRVRRTGSASPPTVTSEDDRLTGTATASWARSSPTAPCAGSRCPGTTCRRWPTATWSTCCAPTCR